MVDIWWSPQHSCWLSEFHFLLISNNVKSLISQLLSFLNKIKDRLQVLRADSTPLHIPTVPLPGHSAQVASGVKLGKEHQDRGQILDFPTVAVRVGETPGASCVGTLTPAKQVGLVLEP